MDMMIGILDLNEPHKLPMKLFFFLFYAKEDKTNRDTARKWNEIQGNREWNKTKQKDRGVVKIDIYIRAATSLCTPEIYFVLYKNDTNAYFILLFRLLLPIAILAIHIFVAHVSLSTSS